LPEKRKKKVRGKERDEQGKNRGTVMSGARERGLTLFLSK
jgi:hypothetical protein